MAIKITLRERRKDARLSVNDMARITGLSPQQVHRLESGVSWFSKESLDKICGALNCKPGDLLEIDEELTSA